MSGAVYRAITFEIEMALFSGLFYWLARRGTGCAPTQIASNVESG